MSYDLMVLLPNYYQSSAPVRELQRAIGTLVTQAGADKDFALQQLWPQTASGWGLEQWESAYGIEVDVSKDVDFRRTRVISKLRGQGTPTTELIQAVAASFVNGEVEIIEVQGEYYFTVKFVGRYGIPPNIDDLTAAINENKPAHLNFLYEYLFRTWGHVKAYTWDALAGITWQQLREGDIT